MKNSNWVSSWRENGIISPTWKGLKTSKQAKSQAVKPKGVPSREENINLCVCLTERIPKKSSIPTHPFKQKTTWPPSPCVAHGVKRLCPKSSLTLIGWTTLNVDLSLLFTNITQLMPTPKTTKIVVWEKKTKKQKKLTKSNKKFGNKLIAHFKTTKPIKR